MKPTDGRLFTVRVLDGSHPDNQSALISYECHLCGEKGTSFGLPGHWRVAKLRHDRDFLGERIYYPELEVPRQQYECAEQIRRKL